jgi:hypothetical protein
VARPTLYESSISLCFKFSPEIQTVATFDFCNSIGHQQTSKQRLVANLKGSVEFGDKPRQVFRRSRTDFAQTFKNAFAFRT